MEGYTPSEVLEAQDKREAREKGKEEAKFYAAFLSKFKDNAFNAIYDHGHIRSHSGVEGVKDYILNSLGAQVKMSEALGDIEGVKDQTMEELKQEGFEIPQEFKMDASQLMSMTTKDFFNYLDTLGKSLIK